MALPEVIRVKLSSEEAGSIALTPVVVQEMPLAELIEVMLGTTGKDAERVRDLLLRGTLVSGASRFRWPPIEASSGEVGELLRRLPDSDPSRIFNPERCVRVELRGPSAVIDLSRAVAGKRRFLRRRSVWDVLMGLVEPSHLDYIEYSHKDRADRYRLRLAPAALTELRAAGGLAAYGKLASQLRTLAASTADFLVPRK